MANEPLILKAINLQNAPEELLSIHFIKFTQDILDSVLQPRYDNMLNCVHASICSADNLIQNGKRCLERSELNEGLNCFRVDFAGFDYLLSTSTKTRKVKI